MNDKMQPAINMAVNDSPELPLYLEIIHQYGRRYDQKCMAVHQLKDYIHSLQIRCNETLGANQELQQQLNELTACEDFKQRVIDQQAELIISLEGGQRQALSAETIGGDNAFTSSTDHHGILSSAMNLHESPAVHAMGPNLENAEGRVEKGSRKRKAQATSGGQPRKIHPKPAENHEL